MNLLHILIRIISHFHADFTIIIPDKSWNEYKNKSFIYNDTTMAGTMSESYFVPAFNI
jgi:hypothetical protein